MSSQMFKVYARVSTVVDLKERRRKSRKRSAGDVVLSRRTLHKTLVYILIFNIIEAACKLIVFQIIKTYLHFHTSIHLIK